MVISDDDFNWKINKSTVTVLLETGTIASVLNFAFWEWMIWQNAEEVEVFNVQATSLTILIASLILIT